MKKQYMLLFAFLLLALSAGAATPDTDNNNTLTFEGETVSGSTEIMAGYGQNDANNNTVIINNSTIEDNNSPLHNSQVVGGWGVKNAANNNRIEITDSTVNRNIVAGQSSYGNQANNNVVTITNSQINEGVPLDEVPTLSEYQVEHRYDDQGKDIYVISSFVGDTVQVSGDLTPEFSKYTVYGGMVANGEARGNQIIVKDSKGTIGNNLVAGYSPYLAETHLHDNSVQVINSKVSGLIVGATSLGANWESSITDPLTNNNNSVLLQSSQVNDAIGAYGGIHTDGNQIVLVNSSANNLYGVSFGQNIFYSNTNPVYIENTAQNNSVRLYNGSTASGNIYGAQSHSVQSRGNWVELAGGSQAQGSVYGAHMTNTRVQVSDQEIAWNTVQTAAENNSVIFRSSTATNSTAEIAGAKNLSGAANSNTVQLNDSTLAAATVAGGWAQHERQTLTTEGQQAFSIGYQANTNTVSSVLSSINADVYGGLVSFKEDINPDGEADTTQSTAWANLVHLDSSSVTGNVYGGAAQGDYTSASYNRVWLTDTQVTGDVYGGKADGTHSYAGWNQLILNNASVSGDVYASAAAQGGNNTVTLSGKTDISGTIYGGSSGNNQLTLLHFQSANPLDLNGFDRPYLISGADTSVTFAQDVQEANVYVQGINDVKDHVMIRTPDQNSSFILHSVDSGVYTYNLTPQDGSDGWTNWILTGGFSAERAKTYAQTAMAALALTNAGDGLLTDAIAQAQQNEKETGTFLQTGYENAKHETGSSIRLHATTALAGLYLKTGDWLTGFYGRYAYGDYNTSPIHSGSYATSWAGGVFGAWNGTENLRLLADARVGWQNASYGDNYLTSASFDYESVFTSVQTGAQYAFCPSLLADMRLRWSHLQGDTITDNLGERIYLSGSDSLLGAVGLSLRPESLAFGYFTPLAKAEVLHEFNGNARSEIEGHRIDTLSLRGTTGRATLGLNYNNPLRGLSAALSGFLEGGQMEGWGVTLQGALRF